MDLNIAFILDPIYVLSLDEFPHGKLQGDVNPLLRGFRFSAMS